jgi:phospholipase C
MARINRRTFLRGAAAGTAAAIAGGPVAYARNERAPDAAKPNDPGAPGASPGWDVPPSTLPGDPADCPIEHIGVLMMENRSYDTYFGWLENGRGFLNLGLDLTYAKPDDPSITASPGHWAPKYRRCGHPDPGHNWTAGRDQLRNGFLAGRNDEYALAYYLAEDVPTYARIARQFTVFDRYFCSVLGGTYPNRHYQHAGQSADIRTNDFPPQQGYPAGYDWPTIWDRLDAAGLTSAYYFVDLPFIAMFGPRHLDKMRPINQFFADAAAGTLPNVYFVDPGFLGDHRTDDHPGGADINTSQAFVNNVAHAVTSGPQWARQSLFVNYDEWGGFFDHVVPPRVPDDRASDDLDDDWSQLGFRLPVMALSPYSRKGYVHHDGPYDHTSILQFMTWRWELEPLTLRTRTAKNIGEAFDYSQAPRHDIGIRQLETPTVFFSAGCDTAPDYSDDFTGLAESQFLRDLGVEVASPDWADVFGNPAAAIPDLGAAPGGAGSTVSLGDLGDLGVRSAALE